jgi:hypothetical protein
MFRRVLSAALVALFCVGLAFAAEYKGTLTAIDTDAKTIKVKIEDQEKTFKYDDKTEFVQGKKTVETDKLKDLKIGKKGRPVEFTTTGEGDKEVASKVTLKGGKKKAE